MADRTYQQKVSDELFDMNVHDLIKSEGEKPYWDKWLQSGIPALRQSWGSSPAYLRYLLRKYPTHPAMTGPELLKDPKFMHLLFQLENLDYVR